MIETAEAYGLRIRVVSSDLGVSACLRDYGEFARPEVDLITRLCDGALVDVGANIGAISLPFAKAKPQCAVLAIEALPEIAAILAESVDLNGLHNISVLNAVAGEAAGQVDIPAPALFGRGNLGASSLYDKGHATIAARMVRLDDVAPAATRFVKIDVEGFEPRVLQGAKKLLADVRPAWLVEVSPRRPNTSAAVRALLSDAGYSLYWFFSPFLTPKRPRRRDERPAFRGDISLLALDGPAPWPMNPAGDAWPSDVADFPYLHDYGLVSARPSGR